MMILLLDRRKRVEKDLREKSNIQMEQNTITETEQAYKAGIQSVADDIAPLKRTINENPATYDREQQQLRSSFCVRDSQQKQAQLRSAASRNGSPLQPQSWLAQQRENVHIPT
ncbi:hypothetical protein CALVIDRAFT_559047 [Calocera viscosa TUFC12733]|uniref:Uncharacterized protein n=1 Tax=Calocera viscosa (strain TUFC12733) TaxID=1330018 RepID=A0A167FRK1_CALVF|nr:hypothetical protein CALVIDRAFT_559047 [Calocera viscosa TUFC12733]